MKLAEELKNPSGTAKDAWFVVLVVVLLSFPLVVIVATNR